MSQNSLAMSQLVGKNNQVFPQMKNSNASLYAVTLLIPIYIGRITEFKPFESFGIGKYAFFIAFVVYLFSPKNEVQKITTFWPLPQMRYLVYFFLLNILCIPFSIWPGQGVEVVISFGKVLAFVIMVVLVVRDGQDLKVLTWIFILSVFGLVLISFISPRFVEGNRVTASLAYDPNDFALLIVMTLAVVYYFIGKNSGFKKVLLLLILLSLCFALMRTASRGGFLAFSVVILAILLKQGVGRALVRLPVIALAVILLMKLSGAQYYERFETLLHPQDDYNVSSKIGRIQVWKHGMEILLENPLVGVGPGSFSIAEGRKQGGGKWSSSHNTFLGVGGGLGFPGLFLFCLIIVSSVVIVRKNKEKDTLWLSNGLEVGMYGFCIGGFFLSWQYAYVLYFYIGLSAVVFKLKNLAQGAENK